MNQEPQCRRTRKGKADKQEGFVLRLM